VSFDKESGFCIEVMQAFKLMAIAILLQQEWQW